MNDRLLAIETKLIELENRLSKLEVIEVKPKIENRPQTNKTQKVGSA
jgi:hypothetical protein